jgi:hypothetical protein
MDCLRIDNGITLACARFLPMIPVSKSMNELAFIRECVAVMCCTEQSARQVFILHEALEGQAQPPWLDTLAHAPALRERPVEASSAGS